jgi:trehalose 6-phosphate synthase/phosphatase
VELMDDAGEAAGHGLVPVTLPERERAGFYQGFANEVLWPLFHDLQWLCNFRPRYWQSYQRANERFAEAVLRQARPGDFVWVHDYHLAGVGSRLRASTVPVTAGYFLHIPFPAPDMFLNLPWRREFLRSMLDYQVVGFQTERDLHNFSDCLARLLPEARMIPGDGRHDIHFEGRRIRAGRFPISIDFQDFHRRSAAPEVIAMAEELRALLPDRQLILGVDRLDYTKGIPHRLEAFARALERFPQLHERVTLIQVVVPSREAIPQYDQLKRRIEWLVGRINGRFTKPGGWVPIHYVFRSLEPRELLAYYRAAQIALITPLKDGMNLVAKEYCACSPDDDGVLILSEFAGAAAELGDGALLVNPCDVDGTAEAIRRAVEMPVEERRERMHRLRRTVRERDVFRWVEDFLEAGMPDGLPVPVLDPDPGPDPDEVTDAVLDPLS